MGEGMLPQVDVEALFPQLFGKGRRIRIALTPFEGTGITVGLPAGLQANSAHCKVIFFEFIRQGQHLLIGVLGITTIKGRKAPIGHIAAAAGKHVILSHHIGNGIALNNINIHALSRRNLNANGGHGIIFGCIDLVGGGSHSGHTAGFHIGLQLGRSAKVELCIAGGIHIDAVAGGAHKEGHRCMGITCCGHRVGVGPKGQLFIS